MVLTQEERQRLIEGNMPLVTFIVKKYADGRMEFEDMFQIGCVGLVSAANTFDPELGYKFSTYAGSCITTELYKEFRLAQRRNRATVLSLEQPDLIKEDIRLMDTIPTEDTTKGVVEAEFNSYLRGCINKLPERWGAVISYKYLRGMTQREVSKILGVSHWRRIYVEKIGFNGRNFASGTFYCRSG